MLVDGRVTGRTRLLGVIGNPIAHSISPQLHNTISRCLGLDMVYVPFHVEKEELEDAVKGLKALNFIGFNVTIPYKKDIIKFIDENSKEALLMGAVNTVKNIDGRLYGYNTDAEGFSRSFKEGAGTGFKDREVVLLGAGGSTRAIAVKIAIEGASKIHIINRTLSKAEEIAETVNNNVRAVVSTYSFEEERAQKAFRESGIIINTTSVGMHPDIHSMPVGKGYAFTEGQIVYDIIYNPVRTKLLKTAEKKGCKVVNGLGMLFYQGIHAYEIWNGIKLDGDVLKEIYRSYLTILNEKGS